MKIKYCSNAIVGLASLIVSSTVMGGYYEYNLPVPDGKGNDGAGQITNLYASYDPHTSELTFNADIKANGQNVLANGYWAVINDGPLPKWHDNEFSIFYADTLNNRLTSYVYNGNAVSESYSGNSWLNGELIKSYSGALTTTATSNSIAIDFSIDVSAINNYTTSVAPSGNHEGHQWQGAQFAETVGMWVHPVFLDNIEYDANGAITALDIGTYADGSLKQSWRDFKDANSTYVVSEHAVVPVPAAAWLFGTAIMGLLMASKRKSKMS